MIARIFFLCILCHRDYGALSFCVNVAVGITGHSFSVFFELLLVWDLVFLWVFCVLLAVLMTWGIIFVSCLSCCDYGA